MMRMCFNATYIYFALTLCSLATSVAAQGQSEYSECGSYDYSSELYDASINVGNSDFLIECSVTPDVVRLKFFEIALCSEKPSPGSTASCSSLFTDTAGRVVDISADTIIPLEDDVSLLADTYTYAFVRISNEISVKATQTFDFDVKGNNGQPGTVCSTNSNSPEDNNVTCGSAANASFSTETLQYLGKEGVGDPGIDDNNNGIEGEFIFAAPQAPTSTSRPWGAYILDSNGKISTSPSDSSQIMAVLELDAATTITGTTSSIDIGFKATDMVAFAMLPCGTGPTPQPAPNGPPVQTNPPNDDLCYRVDSGFVAGIEFYARAK